MITQRAFRVTAAAALTFTMLGGCGSVHLESEKGPTPSPTIAASMVKFSTAVDAAYRETHACAAVPNDILSDVRLASHASQWRTILAPTLDNPSRSATTRSSTPRPTSSLDAQPRSPAKPICDRAAVLSALLGIIEDDAQLPSYAATLAASISLAAGVDALDLNASALPAAKTSNLSRLTDVPTEQLERIAQTEDESGFALETYAARFLDDREAQLAQAARHRARAVEVARILISRGSKDPRLPSYQAPMAGTDEEMADYRRDTLAQAALAYLPVIGNAPKEGKEKTSADAHTVALSFGAATGLEARHAGWDMPALPGATATPGR